MIPHHLWMFVLVSAVRLGGDLRFIKNSEGLRNWQSCYKQTYPSRSRGGSG